MGIVRALRHAHWAHKIEAVAVTVATGAASSGLGNVHVASVPVDKAGMYADVVAGGIAGAHAAKRARKRRRKRRKAKQRKEEHIDGTLD